MPQKLSEIEALKGIDEFLGQLSEEERKRIFNFIMSKYGLVITKPLANPIAGGAPSSSNLPPIGPDVTIKQFVALKRPEGFYELITCLGYYLEKFKGLESFNTKDITKANTDARTPKIPNPSLYVMHCQATYSYLSSVGGGKKALSARGEALVEALPDREAVKLALENNSVKKKNSRAKKKKNNK